MVSLQAKCSPPRIFIPDLLARWPYPHRINPHYDVVEKESVAWIESFSAFSPKAQYAFKLCNFARFASLTYPLVNKEHLRAACDCLHLAFYTEEYSDVSEPFEVQKQIDILMDALRNPQKPRSKEEWIGGEMIRQFWERAIQYGVSESSQKRIVNGFDEFYQGILQQAIDRSRHHIHETKSYLDLRRNTSGANAAVALLQLALDIPDEVISHPAIEEMVLASTTMAILTNDIISYNIEQSVGDNHNIIVVVMEEFGTDVNGAMLWVQDYHTKLEQRFHAAMTALPEWEEPLNSQVKEYCDGLGNMVRSNYTWHFESQRYLGNRGSDVMEKRWVSLLPKRKNGKSEVGPVLVDSSLL